jgi:hypothetical protein
VPQRLSRPGHSLPNPAANRGSLEDFERQMGGLSIGSDNSLPESRDGGRIEFLLWAGLAGGLSPDCVEAR